jgi:hypothetical protein
MDLVNILLVVGSAGVGGVVGGFLWRLVMDIGALNNLLRRIESLENSIKGSKGAAARQRNEERMSEAIAEGAALVQSGASIQEVAKQLAPKYPDIAGKLLKDMMGGKLGL